VAGKIAIRGRNGDRVRKSWLNTEIDLAMARSFLSRWPAPGRWAQWVRLHADLAALTVVTVGFVTGIVLTRDRYLSPDEALHVEMVNLPGLAEVYENSRGNAHPPLFFLILHSWLRLGRSELFLRLLPAIFVAGFLWFAYRWAGRLFGRTAGILTLLVLAFSPALLPLSAEVRGYSLLLLLSASALAAFEKAVEARSPVWMAVFSLLLFLAILTHYGALFVTLSLFVYALARFWSSRLSGRVVATWAVFQVCAAALYLFLYFTQVASLRGGALERQAMTGWLGTSYFHRGQESLILFIVRQTAAVFRYFFGSSIAAAIAFLLAAGGVVHLGLRRHPSILLIVLPFLSGAAAGVLGLYPFGGTRHSSYLLPFSAAAIAVAVSTFSARRPWSLLLPCAALVPLLWGTADWSAPRQSLLPLKGAMDQLRKVVPAGSLIFTDYRTGAVISYYLGRPESNIQRSGLDHFRESEAGSYCVVRSPLWTPDPKGFGDEVERLIRVYGLPPGQRFWVIRSGLEFDMTRELSRRFPGCVFPVLPRLGGMSIAEIWPCETSRPAGRETTGSVTLSGR
jgi:Dolichyl-phosphate-mannose-protein mannosyltransferase